MIGGIDFAELSDSSDGMKSHNKRVLVRSARVSAHVLDIESRCLTLIDTVRCRPFVG